MLAKNLIVENLEPGIWIHLQAVLDMLLPKVCILHIYCKQDSARAFTETGKRLEITMEEAAQPELLWRKYPEAEEIRIYTEEGIKRYDKTLQDSPIYEMDIDEYLEYQYTMLKNTEGIRIYERHSKNRHIFSLLKNWIDRDGGYLFWMTREGVLFFNCILIVEDGKIVRLTTSGRYPGVWDTLEMVKKYAEKEFRIPIFCATMEYGSNS